jgi:voltage-gated potassium channel
MTGTEKRKTWKQSVYEVIFEHDTLASKTFDVALLVVVLASVSAVLLESVADIREQYQEALTIAELIFTGLFTIEYLARLFCVPNKFRYATSFFGIIDLLAVLPTYINLFFPGAHYLMAIRILRMLRIVRIFKLAEYMSASDTLQRALEASREKITIFVGVVATSVVVIGAIMYLVEGEASGFTSIPVSIYWAIVTITTVGYGDIHPQTPLGQLLACFVMLLGYGIIAVPTGIVTVEMQHLSTKGPKLEILCPACGSFPHDQDALFCKRCGESLAQT